VSKIYKEITSRAYKSYQFQFKEILSGRRQTVELDKFDKDGNAFVVASFVACRRAFYREPVDAHLTATTQLFGWLQVALPT